MGCCVVWVSSHHKGGHFPCNFLRYQEPPGKKTSGSAVGHVTLGQCGHVTLGLGTHDSSDVFMLRCRGSR